MATEDPESVRKGLCHSCTEGIEPNDKSHAKAGRTTWKGQPDPHHNMDTPVHMWLTWPNDSADANARFLVIIDDREVRTPADGGDYAPDGATFTDASYELSPCDFNFKKFHKCLTRVAQEWKGRKYGLCYSFVRFLIDTCKAESKGCTPP